MIDNQQFKKIDNWLKEITIAFDKKGAGGADFLYLLDTMLQEKNISFMQFIERAANGFGYTIHEGLYYSLDQNWENPNLFNEVTFFVGGIESESLTIPDYLALLKTATSAYISSHPADTEMALQYLNNVTERYATIE
jgi:hypothetical protein